MGIVEFGEDALWFGGNNLRRTHSELDQSLTEIPEFVTDPWIDHIARFDSGELWLTVWDRGLFAFDGSEWQQHSGSSKISGDQVSYLLPDATRPGNIWIASNRGISRFDGSNWFPLALHEDLRFNRESGTLMQSPDGSIWVNFGTRDWYFRKTTNFNITKRLFETFGSIRYKLDEEAPSVEMISQDATISQPADVFIEWSGKDKWSTTPASQLRYSYRVDDGEWSEFALRTNTTLPNVAPGQRRFEVRAMDSDGNISPTSASLQLAIIPALWKRPWFLASSLAIAVTIVALIVLLYRQRIRHVVQLEELKIQFFTNISHELRTPLTVILGPLESQLAKLPADWDKKPLLIAQRNARKMLRLIDQILDFRSAELGNTSLNIAHADFMRCIRETVELIKPLADERDQTLDLQLPAESHHAWFDAEKVDKIVSNLIGNAIKYTHREGSISVRVSLASDEEETNVSIVVEDNGSGIPQNKINSIFEVFYRAGEQQNRKVRGSGIGLAYTRSLVEVCAGSIEVESPIANVDGKDQGSRFTVTLPLRRYDGEDEAAELDEIQNQDASIETDSKTIALLAEDDADIRDFIADELKSEFQVICVENGKQALHEARLHLPDLVLTDIMMPILDGKELCRILKSSEATSHIPVIMLTALKSEKHELEGLERGADDYIAKPINIGILKQRIRNLLEGRSNLRERFQTAHRSLEVKPEEVTANPMDEAFLRKAIEIVNEHLQDELFDVERFATLMAMSRMTLYRKFKAIAGESPSEFIRSMRLNRAATLLKGQAHTVSEVADQVGISDLSYFSASFKKRFKQTPTQYGRTS